MKWKLNNPDYKRVISLEQKERNKISYKKYYEKNKKKLIPYINAHRKGRLKNATPIWANKLQIRKFYVDCPEGFHVDHIIPLHGKLVSGLHTLENLQYLPAELNLSKGNSFIIKEN